MNRPWLLIVLHCFTFAASRRYRLVKKRQLIIPHDSFKPANIKTYNRLRYSNQHRLLSKSNKADQRIVVIAGPHKTASTSILNNLYSWTSAHSQVLPNWVWPLPRAALEFCKCMWPQNAVKCIAEAFYPFVNALTGNKMRMFNEYDSSEVVNLYQDAMKDMWRGGYSLIIATEAMDHLVRSYNTLSLNKFLNTLPLEENYSDDNVVRLSADRKDVTIVVNFRAPRVEHLVSIWHQCCMERESFIEFLTTMPKYVNKMHSLDSLLLSETFLKSGLNVVLIDMSGIARDGYDISNVVACDILKANCTETEELVTMEDDNVVASIMNVKSHKGDEGGVTEDQMNRIDNAIQEYDCSYRHVLEYENLTVLYNYKLGHIMANCPKQKGTGNNKLGRKELAKRIQSIALDRDGDTVDKHHSHTDISKSSEGRIRQSKWSEGSGLEGDY